MFRSADRNMGGRQPEHLEAEVSAAAVIDQPEDAAALDLNDMLLTIASHCKSRLVHQVNIDDFDRYP